MARYESDPRWITVKFKGGACLRCKRPIHPGERFLGPRPEASAGGDAEEPTTNEEVPF